MKFLIAFAAVLAVAAAVYVTPIAHTGAYSPYVATYPVAYGAHHLYKRGIVTPLAYTTYPVHTGTYAYPYAAVHYRERRQIYTPTTYAHTPLVTPAVHYPYATPIHYRQRRDIYTPYGPTPLAHTAYNTPYATHYY